MNVYIDVHMNFDKHVSMETNMSSEFNMNIIKKEYDHEYQHAYE